MRKDLIIMPQYELMYIVASSISDDQIPTVTDGVLNFITSLGGKVVKEEKLGKKKLAYPIKKTRNGFYDVVVFEMEGEKLSELDSKVRNTEGVIRHLIVNMDEANVRMEKDAVAQEKMNKGRAANTKAETDSSEVKTEEKPVSEESLDQKIEEALSQDLKNI